MDDYISPKLSFCGLLKLFNSREDYDSHAMAHHQSETETPIEQSTEARTT
jgi:hypothetical protein